MTLEKRNIGYLAAFLFVGAILGYALGSLVASYYPVLAIVKKNLVGPLDLDLGVFRIGVRLNLSSIVGFIAGALVFWKV